MSRDQKPGGLRIDFAPIARYSDALRALSDAWAEVPAAARPGLARIVWLQPDGEVSYYRPHADPGIAIPEPDEEG